MWDWVRQLAESTARSVASGIVAVIQLTIQGVQWAVTSLQVAVNNAWQAISTTGVTLARKIADLAASVALQMWRVINVTIPSVRDWLLARIAAIDTWARHAVSAIYKWIATQVGKLSGLIDGLRRWVIDNVWKPLTANIARAWNWITHEGKDLWELITHPDRLASYLAEWVWDNWLRLFRQHSVTIARWLMRYLLVVVVEVLVIVERTIADVM